MNSTYNALYYSHLPNDPFMSVSTALTVYAVNYLTIGPIVSVFGMIGNIINLIVYNRHGFKDSVNVSLMTLAATDFCGLLLTLLFAIGSNPGFVKLLKYIYNPDEVMNIVIGAPIGFFTLPIIITENYAWILDFTGLSFGDLRKGPTFIRFVAWPRSFFSKMTCWITVYITLERCLCIVAPLKVKHILTPRRTAVIMFILYSAGTAITYIHAYMQAVYLVWKHDPVLNITYLGQGYSPNYHQVEMIGGLINTFSILIPFAILILSTIFILIELQSKTKWRQSVASSGGTSTTASFQKRDKVVFKVISALAVALIVCYLPHASNFIVYSVVPDFNIYGKYYLLYGVMWSVSMVLETVNSSCTVLIYYLVSSRYRATFNTFKCITYVKKMYYKELVNKTV